MDGPSSQYPIRVEYDYAEPASRLKTFFIGLLVIPHWIALMFVGVAAWILFYWVWIVIVVTGKRPEGPARFLASYIRWNTRVNGYSMLLTDQYPPFSGDENPQ